MIISKTPFRVSFFGGGTDYPEYFETHGGGAVLATAVSHSAFVAVSEFYSQLFDYRIRVAYRNVECVNDLDEIQHPAFRECLRHCGITHDVEVSYTAELPSFSGMGSSSSCIVGLLHALECYQGKAISPLDLAYRAIELERGVMGECVGCQDQTLAAVGGFNVLEFRATDDIVVHRAPLSRARMTEFEQHLLLLFTGFRRRASDIAARQVGRIDSNLDVLRTMRGLVDRAYSALTGTGGFEEFGRLLDEGWRLKQSLDDGIANQTIQRYYEEGLEAGALGGKLLGAGGGGALLFFVPPERRDAVRQRLSGLAEIPIVINAPGSHIVHA
jgi:D-glycero-alpha-D-manno-heptose-7-phosphate kinase